MPRAWTRPLSAPLFDNISSRQRGELLGLYGLLIAANACAWRSFHHVRRGARITLEHLDVFVAGGGILARLFRTLFSIVSRSGTDRGPANIFFAAWALAVLA